MDQSFELCEKIVYGKSAITLSNEVSVNICRRTFKRWL